MSAINSKTKINRINLWHKFEHYEAVAHIKMPKSNKTNALVVLDILVTVGESSGVLTDSDIFSMKEIILTLKEDDYDTSSDFR